MNDMEIMLSMFSMPSQWSTSGMTWKRMSLTPAITRSGGSIRSRCRLRHWYVYVTLLQTFFHLVFKLQAKTNPTYSTRSTRAVLQHTDPTTHCGPLHTQANSKQKQPAKKHNQRLINYLLQACFLSVPKHANLQPTQLPPPLLEALSHSAREPAPALGPRPGAGRGTRLSLEQGEVRLGRLALDGLERSAERRRRLAPGLGLGAGVGRANEGPELLGWRRGRGRGEAVGARAGVRDATLGEPGREDWLAVILGLRVRV